MYLGKSLSMHNGTGVLYQNAIAKGSVWLYSQEVVHAYDINQWLHSP